MGSQPSGQLAAVAALKNGDYYQEQYDLIHEERARMLSALESLGFRVFPSVANYLLTYLPPDQIIRRRNLWKSVNSFGLFVRDAQNMGVLPSNAVRFAVRNKDENKKMLEIVTSIISKK